MPLEGHWQRVNTPLRRLSGRERNIAIAAVVVTIAACVALIVATAGTTRPAPGPGCIRALIPHVMGSETLDACGARAKHICQARAGDTDPGAISVQEACRRAGLP
ncbi:MAG TPA: hypothetical protein VEP94_03250 [Solirubrobacterales bacterium]|jgi:hypothetical protein|nr:hypothetical protein [Solirubrobacterales bacterium]